MANGMIAPMPYFGGKRMIADDVWSRFGVVENYIEPFAGSLAVLLGSPHGAAQREIVGDIDGMITNFWRAIRYAPDETAWWACYPTSHLDLIARKTYLTEQLPTVVERLTSDMWWFNSQIAGIWVWTISNSIDLKISDRQSIPFVGAQKAGKGVSAQRCHADMSIPHVKHSGGQGVSSQRRPQIHTGQTGQGVQIQRQDMSRPSVNHEAGGQGVSAQRHIDEEGDSAPQSPLMSSTRLPNESAIKAWFNRLSSRLARTYLLCNGWEGTLSKHMLKGRNANAVTGIFFDPPYNTVGRKNGLYSFDSMTVADEVCAKAIAISEEYPDNVRIALCGYIKDYPNMPDTWERLVWRTAQGRGGKAPEYDRSEAVWFSPSCQSPASQSALF